MYFFCVFLAREFFYEHKNKKLKVLPTGREHIEFWSDYLEVERADRPVYLQSEQTVNKANGRGESQMHTYWHNIFGGDFTEIRMLAQWGS